MNDKLKVYVAGSSMESRLKRAETWVAALKELGCDVYDWPASIRQHGANDAVTDKSVLIKAGEEEIEAASEADIFIMLTWPDPPFASGGALVELGAALTRATAAIWVVGPTLPHPLFGLLADSTFASDDDALDALRRAMGVTNA